jgi:hypothetical protein
MMHIQRLNTSSKELVSLAELKEYMRIEHDAEDNLLRTLQRSAYEWIEQFTCRSLLTTQWHFKSLPLKEGSEIQLCLPFPSLLEIEKVNHFHAPANKEAVKRYAIIEKNGMAYVCLQSKGFPVEIIYTAGFGADPDCVPEAFLHAIKVLVAYWFENREGSICGIPDTVEIFLRPYQIRRLI